VNLPTGHAETAAWFAATPCGPCVDYPYAGASVSSGGPRAERDRQARTTLEPTSACLLPEPAHQVTVCRASRGERIFSARLPSLLRV
jgi:hypothetical protein